MTAQTFFDVVPMHVASNPVARAIARKRMDAEFRNLSIRLHMLNDGEDAGADIQVTAFMLAVAMKALELQRRTETIEGRIICGGMGALRDMAVTQHVWRTRHCNAVDVAVQRAKEVFDTSDPKVVQKAYMQAREIGCAA